MLQGGGALGSYQAGVRSAILGRQLMLEFLIGAINAAIIAGSAPTIRYRLAASRRSPPDCAANATDRLVTRQR